MRVEIFMIVVASVGGAALGSFSPPSQMSQAVAALSGGSANLNSAPLNFNAGDVNPIRAAYDYVAQQIRTPRTPESLGFAPSAPLGPLVDFSNLGGGFKLDMDVQKAWGANIAQQNRQFNNRMEDMRNFGANPAGWHGAPPF